MDPLPRRPIAEKPVGRLSAAVAGDAGGGGATVTAGGAPAILTSSAIPSAIVLAPALPVTLSAGMRRTWAAVSPGCPTLTMISLFGHQTSTTSESGETGSGCARN